MNTIPKLVETPEPAEVSVVNKDFGLQEIVKDLRERAKKCRHMANIQLIGSVLIVLIGGWAVISKATRLTEKDLKAVNAFDDSDVDQKAQRRKKLMSLFSTENDLRENLNLINNRIATTQSSLNNRQDQVQVLSRDVESFNVPMQIIAMKSETEERIRNGSEQIQNQKKSIEVSEGRIRELAAYLKTHKNSEASEEKAKAEYQIITVQADLRNNLSYVEAQKGVLADEAERERAVLQKKKDLEANLNNQKLDLERLRRELDESRNNKDSELARLDEVNQEITKFQSEYDVTSKDKEIWFVLTANVTRLVGLLAVLFIGHQLIAGYRYSRRLSAFYESRADLLHLIHCNPSLYAKESLPPLLQLWSPDNIGFGPEPSSPVSDLVKLTTEISNLKPKY